jgi:hypothetical protein
VPDECAAESAARQAGGRIPGTYAAGCGGGSIPEASQWSNLDEIAFSWVGGTERGQAHYVVQGPTFMIEYAQSRNNAVGHIHTIWRDFSDDFGVGLLSQR